MSEVRVERSTRWLAPLVFVVVAVVLYALSALAVSGFVHAHALHLDGLSDITPERYYRGPDWLAGWVRFDSGWYRSIADNGYYFRGRTEQSSVAFFPLYPLIIRWLQHAFGGDVSAWGIPVTFASGFGVAVLYWRWLRDRLDPHAARTALFVLLLWPYAFYLYGAVYADALFVFLVLAAFTCVERERVVLAAVFGALATATRPVGVAVVFGLTARVFEQRGVVRLAFLDRVRWLGSGAARAGAPVALRDPAVDAGRVLVIEPHRLRRADPLILLAATGLLAYMVYLWRRFDDPFAFATAEGAPGWNQQPGLKVWFKTAWLSRLIHLPGSGARYFSVVTFQAVLVLGLVLLVPRIVKRFGWAYGSYTLVLLAFPLIGSKDFQGLGRYALGAFPAFAVFGELLAARPRARRLWFSFSASSLGFFCWYFARGGYVA